MVVIIHRVSALQGMRMLAMLCLRPRPDPRERGDPGQEGRKTMSDELIRALGLGGRVRAVAAVTTDTVETLRELHDPSPATTAALGRTATAALLLAASLEKVTGREPVLTLEIDGGGPAGRLVATASPAGWVRAMVANPTAESEPRDDNKLPVAGVVGARGTLSVTRDAGSGEPYRGVVPLTTGEIATDVAHYLNDSEQTPSAVALGVFVVPEGKVTHSGGLALQVLPGVDDAEADALRDRVQELGTITSRLRRGEGPDEWLAQLFPEGFEILERLPARFHCGCSAERVESALRLLDEADVRDLLDRSLHQKVTLKCGFCNREYLVSRDQIAGILLERAETNDTETEAPS